MRSILYHLAWPMQLLAWVAAAAAVDPTRCLPQGTYTIYVEVLVMLKTENVGMFPSITLMNGGRKTFPNLRCTCSFVSIYARKTSQLGRQDAWLFSAATLKRNPRILGCAIHLYV